MGIQLGSFATNFTNRRIIADAHNERKKWTIHRVHFTKVATLLQVGGANEETSDFCAGYGA